MKTEKSVQPQVTAKSWLLEELETVLKYRKNDLAKVKLLIETDEDAKEFVETLENNRFFNGAIQNSGTAMTFAIAEMRERKIDRSPLSWDEFSKEFEVNPVNALQKLFWQDVLPQDVEIQLTKYFDRNNSLKDLYERHVKNPYDNMFSIIL